MDPDNVHGGKTYRRRRPGARLRLAPCHCAQHEQHGGRRTVHHHPPDHRLHGRTAVHAGLAARRACWRCATAWCGANWPPPCRARGGTYLYLREAFRKTALGGILPFLFIWQFIFSGPLEIASGYIGFAQYVDYFWRGMTPLADANWWPPRWARWWSRCSTAGSRPVGRT